MSRQISPSTNRTYTLSRVVRIWRLSRATMYRHLKGVVPPRRRGPCGPATDDELLGHIRGTLSSVDFHGEGHRKVWARLQQAGIRTSKGRVLRLMRESGLLASHRVGSNRGPKNHDGTITRACVDEMWGTDMTTTVTTNEGQVAVFIAVDHCSFECVGIHASNSATRFEALEPIRQGVRERFDRFSEDVARGLAVRHDHGSQYMSLDFQRELAFLGIESSPAFVRAPEGNGCAERFIRLLKENLLWVRTFSGVEELRQALLAFKHYYNHHWILQRHGYQTPAAVRAQQVHASAAEAA